MNLDRLIGIISDVYPDGLVQLYHEDPEGRHGDTLAKFIAIEVSETFDEDLPSAEQLDEAYRVLARARDDLDEVLSAIQEARNGEEP